MTAQGDRGTHWFRWLGPALLVLAALSAPGYAGQDTVRVAAIQFVSRWGDPEANRVGLEPLIREAAGKGARIVVLPETAITGYLRQDLGETWQVGDRPLTEGLRGRSPEPYAEPVPGPSTRRFGPLAAELGLYLTVPLVEAADGAFYNSLVLIGPDGRLLLHYRKLNPWPWAERGWATVGDRGLQTVDTPYGRLGLLICFDINFEPAAMHRLKVDHLLYAIAWVDEAGSTWFDQQLPWIARTHDLNIIGANWSVVDKPAWSGYGQSRIIRRDGTILATPASDLGNAILYADLPIPR